MPMKLALWGLIATLMSASAVAAAPVSAEQAASVKAAIERYAGHGAPGTSGTVSVTPEGDHYAIALDLKQALRGLEALGLRMDPASALLAATPLEAGTWHVTNTGFPQLTIRHGQDSYSVVANNLRFDGVFDPQLLTFQTSTLSYDSMSVAAMAPQGGTQIREMERGKQSSTGAAAGDGAASIHITQSNEGFRQDVTIDVDKTGRTPPEAVSLKGGAATQSLSVDGLRTQALADLWAFAVAHPGVNALKAAQSDLRDTLRRALPLFDRSAQGGSIQDLSATTPVGAFALKSASAQLRMNGLVADGEVATELTFEGLTIPPDLLPGWADGVVPTAGVLKEALTGFHLDGAARQAVDTFDLDAAEPFAPAAIAQITAALGPLEDMVVTVAPSHLTSRLLNIDMTGEVHLRRPIPVFQATIRATGLDAALQDVQTRSGGDETAAQMIAVLVLAKGLGKAEPDGALSWVVSGAEGGRITVNGLALPGGAGK